MNDINEESYTSIQDETTAEFVQKLNYYDNILDVGQINNRITNLALDIKIQRILYKFCKIINDIFDLKEDLNPIEWNFDFIKWKIKRIIKIKNFKRQKEILENQLEDRKKNNRDGLITLCNNLKEELKNFSLNNNDINVILENDEIDSLIKNYNLKFQRLQILITNTINCPSEEVFQSEFKSYDSIIELIDKYVKEIKAIDDEIRSKFQIIENQFGNKNFIQKFLKNKKIYLNDVDETDLEDLMSSDLYDLLLLKMVPKRKSN